MQRRPIAAPRLNGSFYSVVLGTVDRASADGTWSSGPDELFIRAGMPPERTILTRATRWRLCSGYGRCQPRAVKILASGSMLRSSGTRPPSMQSATPHWRGGPFSKSVRGGHGRGEATPVPPSRRSHGAQPISVGSAVLSVGSCMFAQTQTGPPLNIARVIALKLSLGLHPLRLI